MNFSSESVKLKSKVQNEDFCFETETPRGHFFAVLDFAPHDYANLDATLRGKLETIVGSFVSLSQFSADLFLGFLAKEINNFLHNLGEQSGGPELLCSAAVCLVSGNRLSYYLRGDIGLVILSDGRLHPLSGEMADASTPKAEMPKGEISQRFDRLGEHGIETPLTDQVQTYTLREDDVVVMTSQGVDQTLDRQELSKQIANVPSHDAKMICEALLKASAASGDDRTIVVVTGPYERFVDPVLTDLNAAVASLEAKLSALTEGQQQKSVSSDRAAPEAGDPTQLEQKFSEQVEGLKDDLKNKAGRIDLLELDEKIKNLSVVLASKAETADVLGLQRDVLKLGLEKGAAGSSVKESAQASEIQGDANTAAVPDEEESKPVPFASSPPASPASLVGRGLLILAVAIAAGFLGGWLQSRASRKAPEQWVVKAAGNQILISRLDEGEQSVTLSVAQPVNATGEQTFSSFADVKRYLDTITTPQTVSTAGNQETTTPSNSPNPALIEITVKSGDSLRRLAQIHKVPPEKLMELNPGIARWPQIRIGQKIVVPAPASPSP